MGKQNIALNCLKASKNERRNNSSQRIREKNGKQLESEVRIQKSSEKQHMINKIQSGEEIIANTSSKGS
jgi:hypothetical protein